MKRIILLMALLAAPVALASHHEDMPKGDMSKADFLKKAEERFNKMDSNKDGMLSQDERKAAHKKMREHRSDMKAKHASGMPAK